MVQPAGFWIRLWASILDGLIVNLPLVIIVGLLTGDFSTENSFVSFIYFLYGIILPVVWKGYIVGKRIAGVRIVKVDGSNVHIGNMLMRNVVSTLVYVLTFGIGLIVSVIMVGVREDKRSLHDFIAGTYVTKALPSEKMY